MTTLEITPALIAELREFRKRGSPGLWDNELDTEISALDRGKDDYFVADVRFRDDATLIAAAVNALDALLDEVERLSARGVTLEAELEMWKDAVVGGEENIHD